MTDEPKPLCFECEARDDGIVMLCLKHADPDSWPSDQKAIPSRALQALLDLAIAVESGHDLGASTMTSDVSRALIALDAAWHDWRKWTL